MVRHHRWPLVDNSDIQQDGNALIPRNNQLKATGDDIINVELTLITADRYGMPSKSVAVKSTSPRA